MVNLFAEEGFICFVLLQAYNMWVNLHKLDQGMG